MQATLCSGGKLRGRPLTATGAVGQIRSRLFYVVDIQSNFHFLIDTGADISVLPPNQSDLQHKSDLVLQAANNSTIFTYGKRHIVLNLGLQQSLPWTFIIAAVKNPILGADFLQHCGFTV